MVLDEPEEEKDVVVAYLVGLTNHRIMSFADAADEDEASSAEIFIHAGSFFMHRGIVSNNLISIPRQASCETQGFIIFTRSVN